VSPSKLATSRAECGSCRHFQDSPAELESRLPGFRSLGSALGSVRATDGLCALHDRYLAATFGCDAHERA